MYVVEKKGTDYLGVFKEIKPILNELDLNRRTFERKMKIGVWETDIFLIRKATFSQIKSKRGGKR